MFYLLKLMLIEEYRFHSSYSNKYGFFLFPIMIFALTFIIALTAPQLLQQISYKQIFLSLHSALFLYGIGMGSFAFLGREYVERRSGRINFLISSPVLLPLKFRKTFIAFYLHDVIFYYFMVIIPLTIGLIASAPFMDYNYFTILILSVTLFISFLIGLAFSFFMSAVFTKNLTVFAVFICIVAILISAIIITGSGIGIILPAFEIFMQKTSLSIILAVFYIASFSIAAGFLIEEKYEMVNSEYSNELPRVSNRFRIFRKNSYLIAKEYIDLFRSRTITKIAFSFILPLLFITLISWLLRTNLVMEIEFNSVFYASMVGFFSVMIYYWLTTTDNLEAFQSLPIDVPTIIKIKLIIFLMISSIISSVYIIAISGIYDEFHLLGISLFIMFTTSFYIATSTAYLTGLRTHSYLFNIGVLIKFCILSALPMICLEIIVLNLYTYWFIAITALGLTSIIMIIGTLILYRGIDRKWGKAEFI